MGLAPWGTLGGGRFRNDEQHKQGGSIVQECTENESKLTSALETVAKRKSATITSVAIAYVMHKAPYVFPVLGGRKVEHVKNNIDALSVELTGDDVKEIEATVPFDLGFPNNFLWGKEVPTAQGNVNFSVLGGNYDHVEDAKVCSTTLPVMCFVLIVSKPIKPAKAAE